MKRVFATLGILTIYLAPLQADLTLTQTISMEGPMAGGMGGAQPKMTIRIKGKKSRSDVDVMNTTVSTIADVAARQVIILNAAQKTAHVIAIGAPKPEQPSVAPSQVDVAYKATGQKRTIEGGVCEDHAFSAKTNMADLGSGAQLPPEMAAMMKDVRVILDGVTCIAREGKGVTEFVAFQKAAIESKMLAAVMGAAPGTSGAGAGKLMATLASAPGIPYTTETTLIVEGTGPMVDMFKQMGPMKMVQKTTAVSTDPLADDLFKIPEGYKVEKK